MKTLFLHGTISGVISGTTGIIYSFFYQEMMFLDFSAVINPLSIVTASVLSCLIMAFAYWVLNKWKKNHLTGILNLVFVLFSLLSTLIPLSISLPLEIVFPELFPGLAVPMHFFPALFFFALHSFFLKSTQNEKKNN